MLEWLKFIWECFYVTLAVIIGVGAAAGLCYLIVTTVVGSMSVIKEVGKKDER